MLDNEKVEVRAWADDVLGMGRLILGEILNASSAIARVNREDAHEILRSLRDLAYLKGIFEEAGQIRATLQGGGGGDAKSVSSWMKEASHDSGILIGLTRSAQLSTMDGVRVLEKIFEETAKILSKFSDAEANREREHLDADELSRVIRELTATMKKREAGGQAQAERQQAPEVCKAPCDARCDTTDDRVIVSEKVAPMNDPMTSWAWGLNAVRWARTLFELFGRKPSAPKASPPPCEFRPPMQGSDRLDFVLLSGLDLYQLRVVHNVLFMQENVSYRRRSWDPGDVLLFSRSVVRVPAPVDINKAVDLSDEDAKATDYEVLTPGGTCFTERIRVTAPRAILAGLSLFEAQEAVRRGGVAQVRATRAGWTKEEELTHEDELAGDWNVYFDKTTPISKDAPPARWCTPLRDPVDFFQAD